VWNSLLLLLHLLLLRLARFVRVGGMHAQGHRGRGACIQSTRLDDYIPER
jgi:hypothetical protein